MTAELLLDQERIAEVCRKHRIRRLALFGSVLRTLNARTPSSGALRSSEELIAPTGQVRAVGSARTVFVHPKE